MDEDRLIKKATTAVILHQGLILIGKRRRDGFWELPGGKIDPGESAATCICREVKEELNMEIRIDHTLTPISGVFRKTPMIVYGFLTTWISGTLNMRVHTDIQWITVEDIIRFPFIEEDIIIIQQFVKEGRLPPLSRLSP
jgi:mutator protein MutT